jgi:hypothetical protein
MRDPKKGADTERPTLSREISVQITLAVSFFNSVYSLRYYRMAARLAMTAERAESLTGPATTAGAEEISIEHIVHAVVSVRRRKHDRLLHGK